MQMYPVLVGKVKVGNTASIVQLIPLQALARLGAMTCVAN